MIGMAARLANVILGLWLMAAPAVLNSGGAAATNGRLVGPVVATFATVAIWEATRGVRRVNTVLGAWLLIAPLILSFHELAAINSTLVGLVVLLASLVKGRIDSSFGGGWSSLVR